MRLTNKSLQATETSMASSFELPGVFLGHVVNYSIQLFFSGTPAGRFSLQCSDDPGHDGDGGSAAGVTNWTTDSDSTHVVSAAGDIMWNIQNCGYRWVRVVWVATGAGTAPLLVTAVINAKGV